MVWREPLKIIWSFKRTKQNVDIAFKVGYDKKEYSKYKWRKYKYE